MGGGRRLALLASVATLFILATGSSAEALQTFGALAPGASPPGTCNQSPLDLVASPGDDVYVVPKGGDVITSWSTNAAAASGQMLELKVYFYEKGFYYLTGHDGPYPLVPGKVNTFPTHIGVSTDGVPSYFKYVLGLQTVNAGTVPNACTFASPGGSYYSRSGDSPDGDAFQSGALQDHFGAQLNLSAEVANLPSNEFSFGKVAHNQRKGFARLAVDVPGPGTLQVGGHSLSGGRLRSREISVKTGGRAWLPVRMTRRAKKPLIRLGELTASVTVIYTADGTATGDLFSAPNAMDKFVTLVKRR
jgi:hypothetical protein